MSVIEHEPSFPEIVEGMKKLHIRVADRAEADLGVHLEETTRWIGEALGEEGNRVMVRWAFFCVFFLVYSFELLVLQSFG